MKSYSNLKFKGQHLNYYFICKVKLWLYSHNIHLETESDSVLMGKQLHETSYKREKEFLIDDLIAVDFIKNLGDMIEVHEIKKSKKMEKSHKYQLLYYMYYLKNEKDMENIVGFIDYPNIKEKQKIELSSENEKELQEILEDIEKIIMGNMPTPKRSRICNKCAYFEFCWVQLF